MSQRTFLHPPAGSSPSNTHRIEVLRTAAEINTARAEWAGTAGLVPTMGALHDGHLSLMRAAAVENTDVVVSIYVNPTQFAANEDLDSYPRTWDSDVALLHQLNDELATQGALGRVTAIFAPSTHTMYPTLPPSSEPDGHGSFVTITPLGNILEGASRPVFFRGVATVCMKLFNLVRPRRVYFGQKDAQQCVVIRRMVRDFHLPLEVRVMPTSREADGLAMSSRNANLGTRRREASIALYRALSAAEQQYRGQRVLSRELLIHAATAEVQSQQAIQSNRPPGQRALSQLDYFSVADPDSMEEVEEVDVTKGAILSGALRMLPLEEIQPDEDVGANGEGKGVVRLIDNLVLPPLS